MSEQSVQAIQSDIETTRTRLASTVDELATRAQPKEIARRQAEAAKVWFDQVARTPDGSVRTERVGAALGALVACLAALVLLRRRRG